MHIMQVKYKTLSRCNNFRKGREKKVTEETPHRRGAPQSKEKLPTSLMRLLEIARESRDLDDFRRRIRADFKPLHEDEAR